MGGFGDGGGSPEKGGFMDGINWGITGDDVEELRSKAVQEYWESLLDSPFGAVRVTDRLYILKDWHPMGYLMVHLPLYQTNLPRTASTGMFTEWLTSLASWGRHATVDLLRVGARIAC
jgi:hypothetical protein